MGLAIGNKVIDRVVIVDDDDESRRSLAYTLEDLHIEPVLQDQPLPNDPMVALKALIERGDGILSDYRLQKKHAYSTFDGDRLVAAANKLGFPAVLCTSYTDSDVTMNRSLRRYIPILLSADDYSPEKVELGFRRCIEEQQGNFDEHRRPFRSLVRVEDVEENAPYFYVVVPGWSADQKIRVYYDDMPAEVRSRIAPGYRTHAQVNVGAEVPEDLFFDGWEKQ